MNLHHYAIAALVQSYDIFTVGHFPNVADMNQLELRTFSDAFALGIMLAAPHIVYGLLFYMAGGLMNRLMQSFQVFFVLMSPQILIGMLLLFAIMPMIMNVFTGFMEDQFSHFLIPI
jgi:flagellar biosynthetic protein FliR